MSSNLKSNNPKTKGRMASATAGTEDVEIKVTVANSKERDAASVFGLDPQKAEQRYIYFFDTVKLGLSDKGVILRAREIRGGKEDSTVKIRPVDPSRVPPNWFRMEGFKIEADGVGDRMIRSASLCVEQHRGEVKEVASHKRGINKLFSPDQEEFLSEMSTMRVDFDSLAILGPVDARRWKVTHPGLIYGITAEEWLLPNGRDLLELSIKAPTAQAAAASAAFHGFLGELGFQPQGGQQTKTRIALEYFAKQVKVKLPTAS